MAVLYILVSRLRDEINKGDQPVAQAGWRFQNTLRLKGVVMREQASAHLEMSFSGM